MLLDLWVLVQRLSSFSVKTVKLYATLDHSQSQALTSLLWPVNNGLGKLGSVKNATMSLMRKYPLMSFPKNVFQMQHPVTPFVSNALMNVDKSFHYQSSVGSSTYVLEKHTTTLLGRITFPKSWTLLRSSQTKIAFSNSRELDKWAGAFTTMPAQKNT